MSDPDARAARAGVRAAVGWLLLLLVATGAAGCGASTVPTAPASSGAAAPASSGAAAPSGPAVASSSGAGTPGPSASGLPAATGGPSASPPVDLDPGLLAILPSSVEGVPVIAEPQSFTDALADADFVANVEAAAFAIAVDGNDLSSGVVARLRPGVYSDTFFRSWRNSYNRGACSQAGGVTGNVQTELGGQSVYVTSCAGGLTVYHAYLPARDVVVSLFSLGDRAFGKQLMSDLRP